MTTALFLVLAAAGLWAASGLPALLSRGSPRGEHAGAAAAVLGSVLGLCGATLGLAGHGGSAALPWSLPGASLTVGLDGLSALFLLPVFAVPAIGSVFGISYWRPRPGAGHGRFLRVFLGLLVAGMALLVVARNSMLFVLAWEVMALSAFFLIATEHHKPQARQAAWVYLVATHLGTACLLACFALLATSASLDWDAAAIAALPQGRAAYAFVFALIGFGLKAGLMPLHVWLPAAHANAPSHVSAVLSGVMIKMGAYGVARALAMLPPLPSGCGVALVVLGALSALLGVAATLGQSDVKRLLAYSSIENVGIVFIGLGLAAIGRSLGSPALVVLGLGGALLHVLNHALFKPLLFLAAGSVIHAAGTRELDQLGGLARPMPRTALAFLVGACAICGLPLLNGFAGEYLLYVGLFRATISPQPWLAVLASAAITALAMSGGLAVLAFVRAAAGIFLGAPRRPLHAHESPRSMTVPMLALAFACAVLGIVPAAFAPVLEGALAASFDLPAAPDFAAELRPLGTIGAIAAAAALAVVAGSLWLGRRRRSAGTGARVGTWDCGYAEPGSPRLQYTASSFAQFARRMLRWTVRESASPPQRLELFPAPSAYSRRAGEPLLHGLLEPFWRRVADRCVRLRVLQHGNVQLYLLNVLVVLVLLLGWSALQEWIRQ